jgi:hypothetical protein
MIKVYFNPKVFYYSKKQIINSMVNLNNSGILTSADFFFRITGGTRNVIGRNGTSLSFLIETFGLSGGDNVARQVTNLEPRSA